MSSHSSRQHEESPEGSISGEGTLEVLGNDCSRTILVEAREGPLTAKELTERTESSSATVYRRINDLLDADLLEECIRFEEDGSHTTAYRATVRELAVRIAPTGIEVASETATDE